MAVNDTPAMYCIVSFTSTLGYPKQVIVQTILLSISRIIGNAHCTSLAIDSVNDPIVVLHTNHFKKMI